MLPPMPPPVDGPSLWSWVGNLLAPTGVLALFGLLYGVMQRQISDVRDKANAELTAVKTELDKDVVDLRTLVIDAQRQHLDMLKALGELPTRAEMQHQLEVMENRISDRLDNLQGVTKRERH